MVHNVMEEMVSHMLDDLFALRYDGCACEVCKGDIMAIALNHLPPHYSARPVGNAYIKAQLFSEQYKADVMRELLRAAAIVKKNRLHA